MKLTRRSFGLLAASTLAGALPGRCEAAEIIDVHAHLGRFAGFDLSLSRLLTGMQANHIGRALVSNIDGAAVPGATADRDETTINEETRRVCAAQPNLLPLAWARPGARGASASLVEPFLGQHRFVGVKLHPDFNHFSPDSPAVLPYLRLCQRYRVPAVFHCGGSELSRANAIYRAARQVPTVPVVLYHSGFGTDHREAVAAVLQSVRQKDADLYLETAQMDPASVLSVLAAVGPDRVLFGTDATYYGRRHYETYRPLLEALRSHGALRKVAHENAVRLFRLPS